VQPAEDNRGATSAGNAQESAHFWPVEDGIALGLMRVVRLTREMHMSLVQRYSQALRFGRTIAAPLGIAALAATAGCGVRDASSVSAQPLATAAQQAQAGSPVVVSCEPTQRTLVRPVVVNGATVSQVECITSGVTPALAPPNALTSPAPVPQYQQPRAMPVAYTDLPDARVVTAEPPATVVPARQVVYREPVRRTRSVKKSAIIIGSSAGAGAGVGALIGGKKGALIGAAIGGGGATVWDQMTRRQN
jgi:hypothetical protein